jgi:hypothetical protein
MTRSNCPKCENTMVSTASPLHRIFGDVRAFACTQCDYMMLEYPFEPMASEQVILLQLGSRLASLPDTASARPFQRLLLVLDPARAKENGPCTGGGTKLGPPFIGCYGGIRIRSRLAKLRQRHSFPHATFAGLKRLSCAGVLQFPVLVQCHQALFSLGALCV